MQKIKALRKISYNGEIYRRGEILEVGNNEAHGMIERGVAKLYRGRNKMMTVSSRKGYKIK